MRVSSTVEGQYQQSPTNTITALQWEERLQRQEELEGAALQQGRDRFQRRLLQARQKGQGSTMGAERVLMKRVIGPMEEGLRIWMEESQKARGRRHVALRWVEMLGPDVVAFLTMRTVVDYLHTRPSLFKLSKVICSLMQDEARFRRLKAEVPGLFHYRMSQFQTTSMAHMSRSLNAAVKTATDRDGNLLDLSDLTISPSQRLLIGSKLLDILMECTGICNAVRDTSYRKVSGLDPKQGVKKKDELKIEGTAQVLRWLNRRNQELELLAPLNLPMVVPPLPWGVNERGGYRYSLRNKYPLARGCSLAQEERIESAALPLVHEALNRLQETPWRVNMAVLEVLEEIVLRQGGQAGVPELEELPLPPKPLDIDSNTEARKAWRKVVGKTRDRNAQRANKAREFFRILIGTRRVADEEFIWFPYNADFRGRVYPITDALSPQGDDLQKSLLKFAEGKPVGGLGKKWLAIHGANCLGAWDGVKVSKMTLMERQRMIEELTPAIVGAARDPLSERWWMDADEPLQFLAFCLEWSAFAQSGFSEGFVSSLPVSMDGSCNGLQHFSALFRDEIGGRAVNVVPQDLPQDVYTKISETLLERLREDARGEHGWEETMKVYRVRGGGEEQVEVLRPTTGLLAHLWLTSGLVDRSLTKRPTMTFGYGSKAYGFSEQTLEYLKGLDNWGEIRNLFTLTASSGRQREVTGIACVYLANLIWDALGLEVVGAFGGMDWMQRWARLVSSKGKRPLSWVVPITGFPVQQEYFHSIKKQIKTTLAGSIIQPVHYEDTAEVDPRRQANGVAPNVIHSLDAAALMLTVSQAAAEGIDCFAMVHDSYGTCAGDAELLAQVTRRSFVSLYSGDVAGDLEEQWTEQAKRGEDGEEIEAPEMPPRGSLDIGGVLGSDYFFS